MSEHSFIAVPYSSIWLFMVPNTYHEVINTRTKAGTLIQARFQTVCETSDTSDVRASLDPYSGEYTDNVYFQLRTAAFKAYCAIWVGRSNFFHRVSTRGSPRESTQRRKVELWARNVR